MGNRSRCRALFRLAQLGVALTLEIVLGARMADAQEPVRTDAFLVGSGFLCDPDHAEACPAVTRDASGAILEMSGAGVFSPTDKSITGAGTFSRKSSSGTVVETGIWFATELVKFDSYGPAPGALKANNLGGRVMEGSPMMAMRMLRSPTAMGGLAVFRIRLIPITGVAQTALLEVNCALGQVPPERSVEGIRLRLEKSGSEFSEEVSGRVMFLSMRPEVTGPTKAPHQEITPEAVKPPSG